MANGKIEHNPAARQTNPKIAQTLVRSFPRERWKEKEERREFGRDWGRREKLEGLELYLIRQKPPSLSTPVVRIFRVVVVPVDHVWILLRSLSGISTPPHRARRRRGYTSTTILFWSDDDGHVASAIPTLHLALRWGGGGHSSSPGRPRPRRLLLFLLFRAQRQRQRQRYGQRHWDGTVRSVMACDRTLPERVTRPAVPILLNDHRWGLFFLSRQCVWCVLVVRGRVRGGGRRWDGCGGR
ncbi:hypothetical protein CPB86DRAFT_601145 [Serendipita vermifera]|nr:hypothetical protein CPB86DRAFT_601145 [Serendipita vermifera]